MSLKLHTAAFALLLTRFAASAPADDQYGGIELGSKGLKLLVVEIGKGGSVRKIASSDANVGLASGIKKSGDNISAAALEEAGEEVARFYAQLTGKYRLPPERIQIVISSGVARAGNLQSLVDRVKTAVGRKPAVITAKEEGAKGFAAMAALVDPQVVPDSLYFDVGSGNIKGCYHEHSGDLPPRDVGFDVLCGTSVFVAKMQEAMKKDGLKAPDAATMLCATEVVEPLATLAERKPGLVNRRRVYLAGGAVWAMMSCVQPEDCESSICAFSAGAIEEFRKRVRTSPGVLPSIDLGRIDDPAVRKKAAAEWRKVESNFSPLQLVAAAEILHGASTALHFENRRLFFAREGNVSWLLGFVAEQSGAGRGKP